MSPKENLRPPLFNQRLWRTDTNDDDDDAADKKKKKKPLQNGIDPSSFHGKKSPTSSSSLLNSSSSSSSSSAQRRVRQALRDASCSVVQQKRRQVTTSLKLQRAAFKQVTSLKTWPLQEIALRDLDTQMTVHLGLDDNDETDQKDVQLNDQDNIRAETHGDSTGLSSSSLEEPKRTRRYHYQKGSDADLSSSPRTSTTRHHFQLDFLRERALVKGDVVSRSDFAVPLWCMEPRIFSVETWSTGKRKYMVGALGRFLDYYWRKCDPKQRHFYELIRPTTPCRLYLDLEYHKPTNPELSASTTTTLGLLHELFQELTFEFQRLYDIKLDRSGIVDLDSSTDIKFSRHWIVHLPDDSLFPDAASAGRFVRVLVGRLAEEVATGQLTKTRPILAKHLFVHSKEGNSKEMSCFIDMGVYTRNRLFRLLGSSKYGKPASAALHIAESNEFPFPAKFGNDSFYVPNMEQRIKNEQQQQENDDEEQKLDMDSEINKFLSAVDWTDHATALAETLVVPVNVSKLEFPILLESDEAKALLVDATGTLSSNVTRDAAAMSSSSSRLATNTLHMGTSPFPFIDEFIRDTVASRGGILGAIRAWSVDRDKKGVPLLITYQMSRNRWCERLGRFHRSNNVMWTVDFQTMQCTQTCHDPECRALRFRSMPVELPPQVKEQVSDALFEQELAAMDETVLFQTKNDKAQDHLDDDDDDDEFEKALLALNINDDNNAVQRETEQCTMPSLDANDTTPPLLGEDPLLPDQALLDAMRSNPNLFP